MVKHAKNKISIFSKDTTAGLSTTSTSSSSSTTSTSTTSTSTSTSRHSAVCSVGLVIGSDHGGTSYCVVFFTGLNYTP